MAVDQVNIPDGIGRNDPCPCGSGKKYKKCHYKTHKIEKETQKSTVSIEGLVDSKTTPWEMFKILQMINSNNVANLLWELGHEESPFRQKYPTLESYIVEVATGGERLLAGPDYELLRIRHDGPDVVLMLAAGHNDPKMQSVRAELVTLRPNQMDRDRKVRQVMHYGFRVWDLDRRTCKKSEYTEEPLFENFGLQWQPAWQAPEGWYPPIIEHTVSYGKNSPSVTQLATVGETLALGEESKSAVSGGKLAEVEEVEQPLAEVLMEEEE